MQTVNAQPNNLFDRLVLSIRNSPPMRHSGLGLICMAIFVQLVGVGAVIPIRTIYAREQGATADEIGLLGSAFVLGNLLLQLPGGWIADRWGRKLPIVVGVASAGVLSFLMLLNDHPWYFIAIRFIEGAASGAVAPAANAYVIDSVPARERGAAFGWLGSAFSAGFMIGPAIGGVMSDLLGYYAPFIFATVICLVTAAVLVRKMPGHSAEKLAREVKANEAAQAQEEGDEERARREVPSRQIPGQLFIPALLTALLLITASGFADGLFISIWSIWLNDLHASNTYIGFTFVVFSLPLMLLMPITGRLADKYRLALLIAIPSVLISGTYLAYGFTTDLFVIAAIGLVEGALIAVVGPAVSAFVANLSPENARGRLQGLVSTVRSLSAFASSILVARLYGIDATYPFFMLAGVQLFIGIVGGFLVWRIEARSYQSKPLGMELVQESA
jgi:MFS family permease